MADLTTSYMGLKLRNPIIAGASGLTSNPDTIKKIEKAGAGAIVCKSLFEEEIRLESMELQKAIHQYDDLHAEMVTVFPDIREKGPDYHLYWVKNVKENSGIPVIASLNAVNEEIWIEYAKQLEATGVDGIELNLYSSPDFIQKTSSEIEDEQIALIKKIRKVVGLPIGVKLSPYYTNLSNFITQLDKTGIDGFVLFNRFFQSNIDINNEEIKFPFNFSYKDDNRLPLRFTGLLAGTLKASISSSTGIMDSDDVVRMILAGADAVQVVTALYTNGFNHVSTMVEGLEKWVDEKGYSGLDDFRGKMSRKRMGQKNIWIYKRAQYVRMLMQSSEELAGKIL